ncbi:MAG: DUF1552 domain-containing protein [Deltaproteobacteria bacterium]|nr:DUF1552 domain-containing protein [Deltaproteobacteria bacterium]
MAFKSRTLGRRTMLRGMLAGSSFAVGLPVLEAMLDTHGLAYADGSPIEPVFMSYSWGSGVGNLRDLFDHWTPSGQGEDWELSPNLAPLAPHKEYVTALSNMRVLGPGGHHELRATVFSGQHLQDDAYNENGAYQGLGADRASIDQYIADRLQEQGDTSPFHSLVLCMSDVGRHYNPIGRGHSFSWRSGFQLMTPETSPQAIYQQMFAGFSPDPDGGGLSPEAEVELGALDAILHSANTLRGRLGAADRQRLEAHLEGLYQTEGALQDLADISCEVPPEPELDEVYEADSASVEPLVLKNIAFSKLIAQAFSCGMTRSIQYMFCGMQADPVIADVGATDGIHLLTHNDLSNTQASQPEMIDAVTTFIIQRLADTLAEMRQVEIGDGNLLDHACIMVASEMMDGRMHSAADGTPMLLIGKAGGRLRTNYHYRPSTDGPDAPRNISKALVTAMQAMGIDEDTIDGGLAEDPDGPIDELLV